MSLGDIWDTIKSVPGTLYEGGKDLINWGGKTVKDTFSTQDATTPQYTEQDYMLGGSPEASAAERARLQRNSASSYGSLAGMGTQQYLAGSQRAEEMSKAGLQARGTMQRQAGAAGELYRDSAQQGRNLQQFGDQGAQDRWQQSTTQLGQYQPSSASQQAAQGLTGFDSGQVSDTLANSYTALRDYAQQGPGPSAAEAQLRSAQDTNVAAQVALARSGAGAGATANAMRQAQSNASAIGQKTAADMANLRANEAAVWRGQQLQAMGQAGQVAGTIESAQEARRGMSLSALQSGAQQLSAQDQLALQAQQAAAGQWGSIYGATGQAQQATEQARLAYLQAAQQGQQAAAQQTATASQQYLQSLGQASELQQGAANANMSAQQNAIASRAAYDQAQTEIMNQEAQRRATLQGGYTSAFSQTSMANQTADQAQDKANIGYVKDAIKMLGVV